MDLGGVARAQLLEIETKVGYLFISSNLFPFSFAGRFICIFISRILKLLDIKGVVEGVQYRIRSLAGLFKRGVIHSQVLGLEVAHLFIS